MQHVYVPHRFVETAERCHCGASKPVCRLEYLRAELRAERISYGELLELQGLADMIPAGDVELLEAAGVPEDHGRTS